MEDKRLVVSTVKKSSFCVVNSGETPETVIIAEGLGTALSVQQFRPDATIIAAIDAGNLPSCAGDATALPGCSDHHRR